VALSVLGAPFVFPLNLSRVVFGALATPLAAFPITVFDALRGLFRRVQDAAGLAAGGTPRLTGSKRLFSIAPDADVVRALQSRQIWVLLANFPDTSFRER
jgi:hypothetical protein